MCEGEDLEEQFEQKRAMDAASFEANELDDESALLDVDKPLKAQKDTPDSPS